MSPTVINDDAVIELSVVMPCLNEARTLGDCIKQAQKAIADHNLSAEIVIGDNGSTDGSQEIASRLGARVINVTQRGYGAALMGGIEAARGRFVVMGDADLSYNFGDIPLFLEKLRAGSGLVMGNRFRGGIKPGAMPVLNRYLGNPVLTAMGRVLFKAPARDFQCGLRAFSRPAYERLKLRTTGMEFASEMVVKASLAGVGIAEVPTTLSPDGRGRAPHMRPWRDGWRNVRFMVLYSPRWLFLYPGLFLMLVGFAAGLWLLPGPQRVGAITFDVHTMVYAGLALIVGFQIVSFAFFTKLFAITEGLLPPDPRLDKLFKYVTLEVGLMAGFILMAVGVGTALSAVLHWKATGFGQLNFDSTLRVVIPSATCIALGTQTIFSSFFLSVLGLPRKSMDQ
jgi:glycosyltransferase involved in cell wall biosynthesis